MAPSDSWSWPTDPKVQKLYFQKLQPTKGRLTEVRRALHKVVHVCHHKTGLKVQRVTICGSAGKRTASQHSMDVDLVVFVNEMSESSAIQARLPRVLDDIQAAMDAQYPESRDENWYRKFGLRYNIAEMEIDILIGIEGITPLSFLEVKDQSERDFMSASVSHLNKRLLKRQTAVYHNMVRAVKHWRDSFKEWGEKKPKSYLLEILMLEAFRRCGKVSQQATRGHLMQKSFPRFPNQFHSRVLLQFFTMIADLQESFQSTTPYSELNMPPLFVCFESYYKSSDLPLAQEEPLFVAQRKIPNEGWTQIKAAAIVMDPANPTNNLWLTALGDPRDFVRRAVKARAHLESL